MKSIFITAAFIALVGGASSHVARSPAPLEDPSVKASGLCYQVNKRICSQDCKQVFLCVMDEMVWTPILVANCTAGTYCNERQGTCTSSLSTCSPTKPPVFQLSCTAIGHFPDPFDCTVYHECPIKGQLSVVSACPAGWSYNALTTDCDHKLSSGICFPKGVIPACSTPGQSGAVPENDNIYYVCLQTATGLKHEMFKCNHGGHYLGGQCTEFPVTTPPPTTTEATTEATTTTTVAPPPPQL